MTVSHNTLLDHWVRANSYSPLHHKLGMGRVCHDNCSVDMLIKNRQMFTFALCFISMWSMTASPLSRLTLTWTQ
jgi:hypothetical protein